MESAYKYTEYRYRFLKEASKNFNTGPRHIENRQERVTKERSLSRMEQNFIESIRREAVHRKETIKEIVLRCSDTSFNVYDDEIKRLSWENSKLREELRWRDHVMDKKVNEEKQKE